MQANQVENQSITNILTFPNTSDIIYIFADNEQAILFHSLFNQDTYEITLYNSCVLATGIDKNIDVLMRDVELKFQEHNQSIIENRTPGWLFSYNTQHNMGCALIRRQQNFTSNEIDELCDQINNDHSISEYKYACQQLLNDTVIANHMITAPRLDEFSHNLSEPLIRGWLDEANKLIEPASLIDADYIIRGFIEPISLSNNATFDILAVKEHVQSFYSSRRYLRFISLSTLVQLFTAHVERTCMCDQNTCHALGKELASNFLVLKSKQIKQSLMREYSELCDTGHMSSSDIVRPIIKHTSFPYDI